MICRLVKSLFCNFSIKMHFFFNAQKFSAKSGNHELRIIILIIIFNSDIAPCILSVVLFVYANCTIATAAVSYRTVLLLALGRRNTIQMNGNDNNKMINSQSE
jgi:hypothetical protein